jgi:hypothetical protein
MKEGDRFGSMTFTGEEKTVKGNKYIMLMCHCGHSKWFYVSEVLRPLTLSCGARNCKEKVFQKLERLIKEKETRLFELDEQLGKKRPRYYNSILEGELFRYWDDIEATGNTHNIAKGMEMTDVYLK